MALQFLNNEYYLAMHMDGPQMKTQLSLKITKLFRQIDNLTFEEGSVNMIISYLKPSTMTI